MTIVRSSENHLIKKDIWTVASIFLSKSDVLKNTKVVQRYSHGMTVCYSIQYKNSWLAASDLFDMFTQSIKFYYTLFYHAYLYKCLKIKSHQIDSKNEWLLLPESFTAKFGLVFVLALENAFS